MANSNAVKVGPGTLYVAALGTAEPTAISGAWPAGWTQLGYTDAGSTFNYGITDDEVIVEEEVFALDTTVVAVAGSMAFALAEQTANNLLIALNAGTLADRVAAATGSFSDGTWVEPVAPGSEKRIMLGWDALDYNEAGSAFGRIVVRKILNTGTLSITRRKGGSNKATYAFNAKFLKPTGLQPFRAFFPTSLAS